MILKRLLLFVFCISALIGITGAVVVDIGNPNTFHKNSVTINQNYTDKYSQFAFRFNNSQEVQINKIGIYRFLSIGTGGPYDIKVVNDDNGVPGSTVYAQNLSWSENKPSRYYSTIPLNTTFTLPANTACWFVIDGRNVKEANHTGFTTFDRDDPTVAADGCYGFDYNRWSTAGWNGTSWITPARSGSNYKMYGCLAAYNNDTLIGGQYAINEATCMVNRNSMDGLKITNAPSEAFQINTMSIRMRPVGTPGPVYLAVVDSSYNELANRSIVPTGGGSWLKQTYTFSPAIEIGAGHSTIICVIKAPQGTDNNNGTQIRGIDYVSGAMSYPNCVRFTTGSGGFSNIWTNDATAADTMMNFSITYGSAEWDGINYYVSPSGNNSNDGKSPESPWQTLVYAGSQDLENKTLNLMDGTYSGDQLTLEQSNVIVRAYSGTPIITNGECGVTGISLSNITVDGLALINQSSAGIYFDGSSDNITVQNCIIRDGYNGISIWRSFDSTIFNNYITNMTAHGIHIFGQDGTIQYHGNSVIGNNVSNCQHNMIDIHSNLTSTRISGNDVYFTDDWTLGSKNCIAVYVHNGNTRYTTIDNNTIHHAGRLLELNNVKDSIVRDNYLYDGLKWGSNGMSDSRMLLDAENGDVPSSPYGCQNITFLRNRFTDIGYPILMYSTGLTDVSFSNLTFEDNIFENTKVRDMRILTPYVKSGNIFKDNIFSNFTIEWQGNTINSGDVKFQNSTHTIYDNAGDSYRISSNMANLDIDDDVTNIWYGKNISSPQESILPLANFSADVTKGYAPLTIQFKDLSKEAIVWRWDVDSDGKEDYSISNPKHTYFTAGSYNVSLNIVTPNGTYTERKDNYINVLDSPITNILFDPLYASFKVGSTKNLLILANELPEGTSGYNITVEFTKPEIAEIVNVSFPDWGLLNGNSSLPASSVWIKNVDIMSKVNPRDKDVILGTIIVKGKAVGTTNISILVTQMDSDEGLTINPKIIEGTLKVSSVAPVAPFPGHSNFSTDPDGDGFYEDINGNEKIDFDDVCEYYKNMTWISDNQPMEYFDYDENGRIDYDDVIWLYNEI